MRALVLVAVFSQLPVPPRAPHPVPPPCPTVEDCDRMCESDFECFDACLVDHEECFTADRSPAFPAVTSRPSAPPRTAPASV